MNQNDRLYLNFFLNASESELRAWQKVASPNDQQRLLNLLSEYANELFCDALYLCEVGGYAVPEESYQEANQVLKKFMLGTK